MATQLALQRNFVTIKPSNQSVQSTQTIMTSSSSSNGGEIVTITATGGSPSSDTSTGPIHVIQPVQQVMVSLEFQFSIVKSSQNFYDYILLVIIFIKRGTS